MPRSRALRILLAVVASQALAALAMVAVLALAGGTMPARVAAGLVLVVGAMVTPAVYLTWFREAPDAS